MAEEICGVECRRREHYFSFDSVLYRGWSIQADVWLEEGTDDDDHEDDDGDDGGDPDDDDDDSDCTISPHLHQNTGENANEKEGRSAPHFTREEEREERSTESIGSLHTSGGTYPQPVSSVSACVGGCVPGAGAKQTPKMAATRPLDNPGPQAQNLRCKTGCNTSAGPAKVQRTGPATGILPLPGILDHTTFRRSSVCLGSCAICGVGAAVYQSKEQRTSICEACYARLVREWNMSEGVV